MFETDLRVFVAEETDDSIGAGKWKSLGDLAYLIAFWLMILAMIWNGIIELHDPHSVVSKNIDPVVNEIAAIEQISHESMCELNFRSEVIDNNRAEDMKGATQVSTFILEPPTQNSKAPKDVEIAEIESTGLKQEVSDDNTVQDMKGATQVSTFSLEPPTQNSKATKDVEIAEIESTGLKQEVSDDNTVQDMKGATQVSTFILEPPTQNSKAPKDVDIAEIESTGLKQESVMEHKQLQGETPIPTMEKTQDKVQNDRNRKTPKSPTKQHQRKNRVVRWAQNLFRRNLVEVPSAISDIADSPFNLEQVLALLITVEDYCIKKIDQSKTHYCYGI